MQPIPHTEKANSVMRFNGHEIMLIDVTPQVAADWLRLNVNNRPPSAAAIQQYKADMANNSWPFTGNAICFGHDGTLYDGQHRCKAISELPDGASIPTLVIAGLSEAAKIAMDQGKKRTPADQLTIHGKGKNANLVAASAKQLLVIEGGVLWVDNKAKAPYHTQQKIIDWVDNHPEEHELMLSLAPLAAQTLLAPSTVITAGVVAASSVGGETARLLIQALATGANLRIGSPILALRNRAQKMRLDGRKDTERDLLGLLLRTFEKELSGKSISRIQLPNGGSFTKNSFPMRYIDEYVNQVNK